MEETVTFVVVKEPYGWAVRLPQGAMMPFRWRRLALGQACKLAEARRREGEAVEVVLDETWPTDSPSWRRASQRPLLSWILPRATGYIRES